MLQRLNLMLRSFPVPRSELVYWLQRSREVDEAGEALADPVATHTEAFKAAQPHYPIILVCRLTILPRDESLTPVLTHRTTIALRKAVSSFLGAAFLSVADPDLCPQAASRSRY